MDRSDVVIRMEGLGKKYSLQHQKEERYTSLRDLLARQVRSAGLLLNPFTLAGQIHRAQRQAAQERVASEEEFWALKDVSFEIRRGERVGVIGRNGAGKSTLLKILSRITEPTTGRVETRGRVASLLEVGTGFHPELTGRENIYLNGAILGMSQREVRYKFDEIVEFAEVDKFLDTPVKRYSSGMYVRLAFAVAAHLESDILIVDEVLAVGDVGFQRKCMGSMESVANEGRTILFVSHNMGAISELCTRAVLLDCGRKVADGSVAEIVSQYARMASSEIQYVDETASTSLRESTVVAVRVLSDANEETGIIDLSEAVTIEVDYKVKERLYGLQLALTIARNMVDVFHSYDTDTLGSVEWVEPGSYRLRHRIPPMFLKAGSYSVSMTLGTPTKLIQELTEVVHFTVEENTVNPLDKGYRNERPGLVISPGAWEKRKLDSAQEVA